MTTKGKRPMRALTPGDKIEAIQRVNDGESKASVARDIGVPESTLRGWCKNEDKLRYMTSRLSSPDTDKSNDGEPPDKRARTESPTAPQSPVSTGLDLTNSVNVTHNVPPTTVPTDAPVELTTKRCEPSPPIHPQRERRPDPGASVSMSAISPLSGLGHLPGLTHSHLGLSFNEIATNLTLLAQLNPGLSALSAQPASRALRSVRSPKPAHNGVLNLNEPKHRSKSNHSSDLYRHSSKSSHHISSQSAASQPVDDTLWYWLKTQQAMLDLTAQTTTAHPLQLGKPVSSESALPPKPVAPAPPVSSHLDYNRNSWLWQYYKQFGGAMPLPEDKLKSASQVPKDKSADNILYSHLIKGKTEEDRGTTSPVQNHGSERHASERYASERHASERHASDRHASDRHASDRHASDRHASDRHASDRHASDRHASDHHATDRHPTERHATDRHPIDRHATDRHPTEIRETVTATEEPRVAEPAISPEVGTENKEPVAEKPIESGKSQTKARNVLDNLLFNSSNQTAIEETKSNGSAIGEWEAGTVEALEHGDKFLAWLEASGDPSVTRMHVHQLRALLHNLRTRRAAPDARRK